MSFSRLHLYGKSHKKWLVLKCHMCIYLYDILWLIMDRLTRDGAIHNLHISINYFLVITIYVRSNITCMICTVECVLVCLEELDLNLYKLTTVTHTIILHNRASATDISTYVCTYMQWFTQLILIQWYIMINAVDVSWHNINVLTPHNFYYGG